MYLLITGEKISHWLLLWKLDYISSWSMLLASALKEQGLHLGNMEKRCSVYLFWKQCVTLQSGMKVTRNMVGEPVKVVCVHKNG